MIPTYQGPVGLRRPRDVQKISLHHGWFHKTNLKHPITITKGWLTSQTEGGKMIKVPEAKDVKETYRLHVKQAMLIASTGIYIQDMQGPNFVDPMTQYPLPPDRLVQVVQEASDLQRAWVNGTLPVPAVHGSSARRLSARPDTKEERHKLRRNNRLIKMGRKTYQAKERVFRIDNGKLKVYKIHRRVGDKPKTYDLADVPYQLERSDFSGLAEPFHFKDYSNRVRLNLRERPQGPVYLYTQDAKEAKSWERAVRMSKYLGKASDREALRYVVGRVAGSVCSKAWGALFDYFREISSIKEQVKNLSMRLMREDLSRGWTKARLVYQQRMQREAKREEQIGWVNKILKERVAAISNQALRSPTVVLYDSITKVQKAFRHYRTNRIMERNYFLGNSGQATTRAQQAVTGVRMYSAFSSLKTEEVLKLVFEGASVECLAKLGSEPELLGTKSPSYSMVMVPLRPSTLTLSEKFNMLTFAEVDEHSELSHLAKGSWAHFVNVNQISSIVLNTPRVLRTDGKTKDILQGDGTGVWFTINGPRVCWGRKAAALGQRKVEVIGATDGYRLSKDLAQGFMLKWLHLSISIDSTTLPHVPVVVPKVCGKEVDDPLQNPDVDLGGIDQEDVLEGEGKRYTYMVMHVLGRRFESQLYEGDEPSYWKENGIVTKCETIVPVPEDLAYIGFLDHHEISVDIMEWYGEDRAAEVGTRKREKGNSKCIWTGQLPLNMLFAREDEDREVDHKEEHVPSLSSTVGTSSHTHQSGRKSIRLREPSMGSHSNHGVVMLSATTSFEEVVRRSSCPISPELQGTGPLPSLYSSHRGAWCDPNSGDPKFITGQAASFVEVIFDELKFPETDQPDAGNVFEYTVEATCMGVTVSSIPIHRAKPVWGQILSVNPNVINFDGTKVFVPLPPGAWCAEDRRPRIELCIVRTSPFNAPAMDFREFRQGHTPRVFQLPEREPMYRAFVGLDGMLIDEPRHNVRVMMWTPEMRPPEVMISAPEVSSSASAGVMASSAELAFSATLRDREFVRLHSTREMGQETILCVGEKAMLKVEEPINYPQTDLEFRRRCFPGEFDPANTGNHALAGHWGPLRDPNTSTEYQSSGLGNLSPAPPMKTRYIPTSCEDLIPHKFLMPKTEAQFRREARPGVWWRIVERLVRDSVQGRRAAPHTQGLEHPQIVVEELSHVIKRVPVTILAVYADRTCDVEIDPAFASFWERHPEKHFCFPGNLLIRRFQDTSQSAIRAARPGTGDVGERSRIRAMFKGVPVSAVEGVQATSFNIYDANYSSAEDAIQEHPCSVCNDFNPRYADLVSDADYSRKGGYFVRAGPLPPDAGTICQYEWSLHLHAKSEDVMYQFITNLRQAARLDLQEQLKKLDDYKLRQGMVVSTAPYNLGMHAMSSQSGHLEVVLVEARHLQPSQVQADKDLPSALKRMSRPAMNASATFMLRDKTRDKVQELVYRGSKMQNSSIVEGINPSWAKVDELKSSGGWVFKSPVFDPGAMPGLGFELHLWNGKRSAGLVRVPVTGGRHIIEFDRDGHHILACIVATRPPSEDPTAGGTTHLLRYWDSQLYLDRHEEWVILEPATGKVYFGHGRDRTGVRYTERWFQSSPGVQQDMELCKLEDRWHNLWLPLSDLDPNDPEQIVESISGEVHILTLWVPARQTDKRFKYEPKTARAWRAHSIRPKLQLPEASLRDPTTELQCRKRGYNPNLWREEYPRSRAEAFADYVELIEDTQPYLACYSRQSEGHWVPLYNELQTLGHLKKSLGEIRREAVGTDLVYNMNELLRRGVPPSWRRHIWMEILGADKLKEEFTASKHTGEQAVMEYRKLLFAGTPSRSDAMVQLQEDIVGASGWETSMLPAPLDRHLSLLSQAQGVCIALIAFSSHNHTDCLNFTRPAASGASDHHAVLYSESLLVLAFFLLVAQGPDDPDPGHPVERMLGQGLSQVAAEADADRAFWMLYALLDSDAYSTYYAVPGKWKPERIPGFNEAFRNLPQDASPMCSSNGPMEDVWHLRLCVARYDKDLWVHLEALGFQLASIFYGAFLRLFAFSLPPPSVFRFWDALFADVTDPKPKGTTPEAALELDKRKPPRRLLICLAFGVLRRCKEELLRCQSALEIRDCIVSYMESMYDPSAVVELAAEMELFLWDPLQREIIGVPRHTRDFEYNQPYWEQYFIQFHEQNLALREVIQKTQLDQRILETLSPSTSAVGVESFITTRNLVNVVIPQIQKAVMPSGRGPVGGMFRPLPKRLRHIAPETDKDLKGTITSWATWVYQRAVDLSKLVPDVLPPPRFLPRPPGALGEPETWDIGHLQSVCGRSLGAEMAMNLQRLHQTFQNNLARSSITELIAALICASKGTAGEKAMALFYLYASTQPLHRLNHITPVTHNAATVIEKIEGNMSVATQLLKRPKGDEIKNMALHFRIFTHTSCSMSILLGEVFIPSLLPFVTQGMGTKGTFQTFVIWKAVEELPSGVGPVGPRPPSSVAIGDMRVAISWTPNPNLEDKPEVGQLGIFLDSIQFRKSRVEQMEDKNPRITVVTYDQRGDEVMIPRWDPRTTAQMISNLGSQLFIGEAYGEHMEFPETKWRDAFGFLHNHGIGFAHHGWNDTEKKWMWDARIGKQYSVEDFTMRRELCRANQQTRPNTISLKSCRIIAEGILQRSLHHLTNRQAALIADQAFSRAGAVPGIIEAILVEDGPTVNLQSFERISDLQVAASEKGIAFVDVRHQLVMAHEDSIAESSGSINLFAHRSREGGASPMQLEAEKMNLSELQISDPFPGKHKVLWIRFVRSGDGQRFNATYKVDGKGEFPCPVLKLDMECESTAGQVQMNLTKEEFVTCILSNPILGEALRRMTTFDNSLREVPAWRQLLEKPLRLNVAVADPTREEADADFMDAVTVQQSILFEVYDSDRGSLSDFLGECYLPPFDRLSSSPTAFVLPLSGPAEGTRPADQHKDAGKPSDFYTGNLFIEASWVFPAEDVQDLARMPADTLEQRAKKEEILHTGTLEIKVVKAEGLRQADIASDSGFLRRFQEGSGIAKNDVYVTAYVKNEACITDREADLPPGIGKGGWRVKAGGLIHEPLFQTKTITDSMPVWNETFTVKLQTGAFEKRTKQRTHVDITRRAQQQHEKERLLSALHGNSELLLRFGEHLPAPITQDTSRTSRSSGIFGGSSGVTGQPSHQKSHVPTPGERHEVKVFLGDTVFQFKRKVAEACRREADCEDRVASSRSIATSGSANDNLMIEARKRKAAFEAVAHDMSYRYAVMVFVPSRELRDMYRADRTTGYQYENLYNVEFADPSSWQPLDPLRTFQHYAGMYGFGSTEEELQQLRVVEGTEDYKSRNNRYRHFVQEEQEWRNSVEQVNKATECYGYAKYIHRYDGGSTEWRPILAERVFSEGPTSPSGGEGRKKFRVAYIHTPVSTLGEMRVASPGEDAAKVTLDESDVLLAPSAPKLLGPTNLDHIEYLRKARALEDEGLTEEQIVKKLNQEIIRKWQQTKEAEVREQRPVSKVPQSITLREVQHALRNPGLGGLA